MGQGVEQYVTHRGVAVVWFQSSDSTPALMRAKEDVLAVLHHRAPEPGLHRGL